MDEKVILIADDAVFMRKMIRSTLESAGYTKFLEAKNGNEAIALYQESGADLIFLDVTMPDKDGLQVLKEIMAMRPDAKVVMCSAIGQDGTIMDAIRSGASEFIIKPFKRDQVIDVVSSLLG
ncbi:MAG: response regulator [Oscillospiraceae bacterium]|nr:response regulator [Oscillospiraceae bacterium]